MKVAIDPTKTMNLPIQAEARGVMAATRLDQQQCKVWISMRGNAASGAIGIRKITIPCLLACQTSIQSTRWTVNGEMPSWNEEQVLTRNY